MTTEIHKDLGKLESFLSLPPPKVSFEFFPPKTEKMEQSLWETIKKLEPLNPEFVSVTYGAGGGTREKTYQSVKKIREESSLEPVAHLTCVGSSKEEINEIAKGYWNINVNHILALRGDPPSDSGGKYTPHPEGYAYCADLVTGLKDIANFEITVAAFPETHPEATSEEDDIIHLKEKFDAGAARAITQYFFDTDIYLKFLEKTQKAGIDSPIIPGIILVSNFKQLLKFSKMCGTTVPKWIYQLFETMDEYPERRQIISAIIAAEQCRILREEGVEQFHFYTMNRPTLAASISHLLGLRLND